jgi:hypothetical protein
MQPIQTSALAEVDTLDMPEFLSKTIWSRQDNPEHEDSNLLNFAQQKVIHSSQLGTSN